jgi:secreted trypsin-like serine protease
MLAVSSNLVTPATSTAIDGGSAANGNPFGLRILRQVPAQPGFIAFATCSAGVIKPRIIVTNAHCLKKSNTEAINPSSYVIYPPGVNATATPTTFSATQVFVRPGFNYETTAVQPNDIAFLITDRDVGPQSISGLATREEIDEFIKNKTPLAWFGYGTSATSETTNDPRTALGLATGFARTNDVTFGPGGFQPPGRPCPGDSGSPIITKNAIGQDVLVAVTAGAGPDCQVIATSEWSAIGPIVSAYPDLIDAAFVAAGYPLLPSEPTGVRATVGKTQTVVNWQPPARNATAVRGYRVMDGPRELCRVDAAARSCSIASLDSAGAGNLRVQALNGASEGALSGRASVGQVRQVQCYNPKKYAGKKLPSLAQLRRVAKFYDPPCPAGLKRVR